MTRYVALTLGLCLLPLGLGPANAQTPPKPQTNATVKPHEPEGAEQKPKPAETTPPRAPESWRSGPNVRVELTLTDQTPGSPATTKTVMITTTHENWGRLRSALNSRMLPVSPLNVDARPFVRPDGRIFLELTIDYAQEQKPSRPDADVDPTAQVRINESVGALLDDGKPLLITQSADPTTDRKVTVEVKATVLK